MKEGEDDRSRKSQGPGPDDMVSCRVSWRRQLSLLICRPEALPNSVYSIVNGLSLSEIQRRSESERMGDSETTRNTSDDAGECYTQATRRT